MGRSREPPVFARFGRTNDETKVAGWRDTRQSGSPPSLGRATPRCSLGDENELRFIAP